ncbi:MAG: helix-turn-helix domain-containing protein [Chloroflexota bacterium]
MKGKRSSLTWNATSVRALRRYLKLSQAEMAQQLGTRQQTISEWETGKYCPRGTSSTLLSIVAEHASFRYQPSSRQG